MDTEVLMVPEEKPKSQPPSPRASTVPNSVPNESSTKEPEPQPAETPVEGDEVISLAILRHPLAQFVFSPDTKDKGPKREKIIAEIVATERSYVGALDCLTKVFFVCSF